MNLSSRKKILIVLVLGLPCLAGLGYVLYAGLALREIAPAAGPAATLLVLLFSTSIAAWEFHRRRRTMRELRELRERFDLFTDGLKDSALMMLAADGTVTYWSSAAERLQGFSESDIVGRHYSLLFPADIQRGTPEECLLAAEADGRHEQTGPRVHKNGSISSPMG